MAMTEANQFLERNTHLAILKLVFMRTSCSRAGLPMSNVNPLLNRGESETEKFIDENLSPFHVRWLTMQSQALGHTRTRIFEAILSDWLSRYPSRNRQRTPDNEIARQAVEEFILRYESRFFR
jgi:hypothetical protein